jgi:hypothetical protein
MAVVASSRKGASKLMGAEFFGDTAQARDALN